MLCLWSIGMQLNPTLLKCQPHRSSILTTAKQYTSSFCITGAETNTTPANDIITNISATLSDSSSSSGTSNGIETIDNDPKHVTGINEFKSTTTIIGDDEADAALLINVQQEQPHQALQPQHQAPDYVTNIRRLLDSTVSSSSTSPSQLPALADAMANAYEAPPPTTTTSQSRELHTQYTVH